MFINFWYPMARTEEVSDVPVKVRCMSQDFVVFRGEDGEARCLSNTCSHRGGALAGGKINGNHIQCPYHGWQFDGEGACQRIPSLGPDASIPGRTGVDAYPVQEKHGMIFAFLGDLAEAERPPILPVPEWDQEGWRPTLLDYDLDANYERSIENGIDPAHNEYVHDTHGFSGEDEEYRIGDMREEHTEWGQGFWHTFNAPKLPEGELRKLRDYEGDLEVGTGHHGPNQVWTYIHVDPKFHFHQYLFERPLETGKTHIYLLCMRNCMLKPDQDEFMDQRNWYVAKQDVDVITQLNPIITPDTNNKEFMVPADKSILMYRDKLREWTGKGWRVDMDEVERNRSKVAYAVPSPARREQKGWVVDPVPLVSADAEAATKLKATG
jgi:phenylpropionate dioxygenase-like ring-hydroxylating dioxygenase large terminal subunit